MATATSFLLKANPLFLSQRRQNIDGNFRCMKCAKFGRSSRLNSVKVKSFMNLTPSSINKNNTVVPSVPLNSESKSINSASKETPENNVLNTIFKTLTWLKVSGVVTVHSLLLLMMIHGHDWALARSGGAMGGHSFSSSSTRSKRSSTSSSSSSTRSSRSSTSSSSSSSSRPSYSSSSSSARRPSYSSSTSSASRPSYSSSSSSSSSQPSNSPSWNSGSNLFSSPLWSSSQSSSKSKSYSKPKWNSDEENDEKEISLTSQSVPNHPLEQQALSPRAAAGQKLLNLLVWSVIGGVSLYVLFEAVRGLDRFIDFMTRTSVIKLQVGLFVPKQSLQRDLNRIAETADTSASAGWIDILQKTTDSLLRHLKYSVSYDSSVDVKWSLENAEECFKQLSLGNRAKYDEETLLNLNNMKKEKITRQEATQLMDTYVVVTILVVASGIIKLPIIKELEDLKNALQKLRSIHTSGGIQAVNVIWTPQEENEIMSLEELHQDYPHLKPLST